MRQLWAVSVGDFQAFLMGMQVRLQACAKLKLADMLPYSDGLDLSTFAGPIEEARRLGLPIQRDGSTAVVSLSGPMMKNPGFLRRFGFTGTNDIRAAVRSAVADDEINNIVLRVDSPGGEVDGTAELADDVRAAAGVKNVIAQSDGMIASAAYWVASQASVIHAGRMDLIGSIGVRMLTYDLSKAFEQAGIRAVPIDTGPFKSTGAMGTEITPEQEAYLQGLVDSHMKEFRAAVMGGRSMNAEQFDAVGDGRIFVIEKALPLGLIDKVQGIETTVSDFRKQASVKRRAQARLTLSNAA